MEEMELDYKMREKILAKDVLGYKDLQLLLGMSYGSAGKVLREIKRKTPDILGMDGKIHTTDYLTWCGFDRKDIMDRHLAYKRQRWLRCI